MAIDDEYRFLYVADVHGNKYQTLSSLVTAFILKLDGVVFGGDIAPKEGNEEDGSHRKLGHRTRHPESQREYYEDFMIPLFEDYALHTTDIDIYTMMSNDDFRVNMSLLEEAAKEGKFKLLHEQAHQLPNGLFIVGTSYVDLTPFVNKDWEKWDLSDPEASVDPRTRLKGYSSTKNGLIDYNSIPRTDSLEAHLFSKIMPLSDPTKTIYIIHAPPYNTDLDQRIDGSHGGSKAVRMYFEEVGALLGLHGHFHETVDVSGNFLDKVGDTIVAAPGNNPFKPSDKYYTDYSRTLRALIVSASEEGLRIKRVAIEFDEIELNEFDMRDLTKIDPTISRYVRELK